MRYRSPRHANATRVSIQRYPVSGQRCARELPARRRLAVSSFFIDSAAGALWANADDDLVRVDLASLTVTTVAATTFVPAAGDATSLYGTGPGGAILRRDRATGATTTLRSSVSTPTVLHVDGSFAYYATRGSLAKVAKDAPGITPEIAVPGPSGAWQMAVDGGDVVWWRLDEPNIYRMALSGGAVTTISTGALRVRGVTWDSTRYYFMESPQRLGYEGNSWRLWAVPK